MIFLGSLNFVPVLRLSHCTFRCGGFAAERGEKFFASFSLSVELELLLLLLSVSLSLLDSGVGFGVCGGVVLCWVEERGTFASLTIFCFSQVFDVFVYRV